MLIEFTWSNNLQYLGIIYLTDTETSYIQQQTMKRYTMLSIAAGCFISNIYGFIASLVYSPVPPAVIVTSIATSSLLIYIQLNKKDILLDGRVKQSFLLFGLVIVCQIYFAICALTLMVYLNMLAGKAIGYSNRLSALMIGSDSIDDSNLGLVQDLNLPYYLSNFVLLMFYIRCYYVMFWQQNIVFIYRYLRKHVEHLNHTLLSHLPIVPLTKQLQDSICSLCLQDYSQEDSIARLYCRHHFHLDCIKVWVMKSNACPLCRHKVVFY